MIIIARDARVIASVLPVIFSYLPEQNPEIWAPVIRRGNRQWRIAVVVRSVDVGARFNQMTQLDNLPP